MPPLSAHRRFVRHALVALALPALFAVSAAAAPLFVILTVPTPNTAGAAGLPAQLSEWRMNGLVADDFLLQSNRKDAPFAALAVLQFPDEDCIARWREVGASELGSDIVVTPVDRLASGETFPRDSSAATFEVARYDVKVAPDAYARYVSGYVAPELEAMRKDQVLTSYFAYAPQQRAGAPWQALILMEFPNSHALDLRPSEMADVRGRLASDPAWKAYSDEKQSIRTERSLTEASWILLPPPALADLPAYRPQYHVIGTIRVLGSFLKYTTQALEDGFLKYQPDAQFASNFSTSSEGAIGGLCTGVSDLAPMGDDAKISDRMPFYNVYGYLPTEISVATGDYEKRGALWPAVILVNRANPLAHLNMDQLDRIFGAERTGGWDVGHNPEHNILFTARYARGPETNLRTWGQLGLGGDWAGREIQTYGYCAPGFATYFQRKVMHWSHKYNPNFREFVEPKEAEDGPEGDAVSSLTMLKQLSNDPYGIAWAAMFHAEWYPNLKPLAIAPGATRDYVAYTPENVANHTYPLTRDAYFYVNKEPGRPLDPKVREFMRFILSREGQQIIAHTGFFYPLQPAYLEEQLRKLD